MSEASTRAQAESLGVVLLTAVVVVTVATAVSSRSTSYEGRRRPGPTSR